MIEVNIPPIEKLINKAFIPAFYNEDRCLILWGGRGSSKSIFAAKKLIIRCLSEDYFRFILYRNVYETIRDSQWQTIKDVVEDMGLSTLFRFTRSPLEIVCVNGNKFIARGGDKTSKIKSMKDPTGVWLEEDLMSEDDYYNISGSIRTTKADYLQEIFTLNPETTEPYESNWFWKRFFEGRTELTFNGETKHIIDNKEIYLRYYCHHSTYHDNRFLPDEYKALLESYKQTNPYKYMVHTLGIWGNKEVEGRFWKSFDLSKHTGKVTYNPNEVLHISFDENVNPYPALSVWQMEGSYKINQIHEIALKSPNNKLKKVAYEFCKWARKNGHKDMVYIYGDATSRKEDAKLEAGHNYFTLLKKEIELNGFRCKIKTRSANPPVALSGEFINEIYANNYMDLQILIGDNCTVSIADYLNTKETMDGKVDKKKVKGVELWGHFSDNLRYLIVEVWKTQFKKFQNIGGSGDSMFEKREEQGY